MAGAPNPGDLRLGTRWVIPAAELRWRFSRSSGPGGQHVNTTDSRVELRFDLASTVALSAPLRQRALERLGPRLLERRLVELLLEALKPPPPPRRPTKPTRGSVQRRLEAKKQRSAVKQQRRGRVQPPDD
jgi:ribosome-associated protein